MEETLFLASVKLESREGLEISADDESSADESLPEEKSLPAMDLVEAASEGLGFRLHVGGETRRLRA